MIEGSKILLVDDNPEIIQLLSDFLFPYNCDVFKASMGREAIKLLEDEPMEIAILDIKLPDMDGITLLDEIRMRDPTIGVVMITGYNDPDMIIEAMKKGASDFLIKPFSTDKLMLAIMRVRKQRDLLVERNSILSDLEDKKKIELLNRQLQVKIAQVTKMYHISNKFNSLNIFEDIYEKTVNLVNEVLNVDVSGFYVVDHENERLMLYKTRADRNGNGAERSIPLAPGLVQEMNLGKRHFKLEDKAYSSLVIKGECVGAIMVGKKSHGSRTRKFTEDDLYFLNFIADKASMQIENRMLYESLFEGVLHTLTSLIIAINRRDLYTEDHCKRVAEMCLALSDRMGAMEYQKDEVRVVAPIHDVGKIGIPDSILLKPSKLTNDEYALMKNHSVFGEEIINRFDILSDEAKITRHHHESFDGSGYPDGMVGEAIPYCSRLIAVCDTYDAMVNDRPYRKGLAKEEAMAEIGRCKGKQLDPDIAETFLEMMRERYFSK